MGNRISAHHVYRYEHALSFTKGRTLDAACGVGYGSKILMDAATSVCGVDISPEAIEWAKKFFRGPQFIQGRIEESPWVGEFETVVSFETIEHLKAPDEALEALSKACKGNFIASVPNEDMYPFKPEVFAGDAFPHYRHYTPQQFEDLLKKHGFRVEERFCQKSKYDAKVVSGVEGRFLVFVCSK